MKIQVASKTFLLGEYVALSGGPCLLLLTEPIFSFEVQKKKPHDLGEGFALESPAGKLIQQNFETLNQFSIVCQDPYFGGGGFGASTAEYAVLEYLLSGRHGLNSDVFWNTGLKRYRQLAQSSSGKKPSGADLMAQMFGEGICFWDERNKIINSYSWPFMDLDFLIIKTVTKVATHHHLNEFTGLSELEFGRDLVNQVLRALNQRDSDLFVKGVNEFNHLLQRNQLVAASTEELIRSFRFQWKAVKGCGALGADTILVVIPKEETKKIRNDLIQMGQNVVTDSPKLCRGFSVRENGFIL